jgi:hypothetical protein
MGIDQPSGEFQPIAHPKTQGVAWHGAWRVSVYGGPLVVAG